MPDDGTTPLPASSPLDPSAAKLTAPAADAPPPSSVGEEQPPDDAGRNWWPWVISGVLLVVLAGLGVWYFTRSDQPTVAVVVGLPVGTATARLQQDGFKTQIVKSTGGSRPGVVLAEQPAGGSHADKGSIVALTVAVAPASVTVPNAVGLSQADARDRLVAAGFKVTSVAVSSAQPTGTAVAQAPAAGAKAPRASAVRINVSQGSATASVPSEVGQMADAAQRDLAAKGFKPSVTQVVSSQPADTVVEQSPTGGQARKGSAVVLSVSSGPATTTTQATQTTTVTAPADSTTDTTTTTSQ